MVVYMYFILDDDNIYIYMNIDDIFMTMFIYRRYMLVSTIPKEVVYDIVLPALHLKFMVLHSEA